MDIQGPWAQVLLFRIFISHGSIVCTSSLLQLADLAYRDITLSEGTFVLILAVDVGIDALKISILPLVL